MIYGKPLSSEYQCPRMCAYSLSEYPSARPARLLDSCSLYEGLAEDLAKMRRERYLQRCEEMGVDPTEEELEEITGGSSSK